MLPYRILARGPWLAGQVTARTVACSRRSTAELDAVVDGEWDRAMASAVAQAAGRSLFDGPMMRLERCVPDVASLTLELSVTSYKPFYVLHMLRPDLLAASPEAAPNPLGISAALLTADGKLLLGMRSGRVAYYPHRVHPFAGTLEPADNGNPFLAAQRELGEELALAPDELANFQLLALAEDLFLRQPEAILSCRTSLTAAAVRARLDKTEHSAVVELDPASPAVDLTAFTPVAMATLAVLGLP